MNKLNAFFLGIVVALIALVFETLFSILTNLSPGMIFVNLSFSMIILVLFEEFLKIITVLKISQKSASRKISFLNSILAGAGFGITEIFLYTFDNFNLFSINYLNLLLIHTFTFAFLGFFIHQKKGGLKLLILLLISSFFHFSYNLTVFLGLNPQISTFVILIPFLALILKVFLQIKDN